MPLLLIFLSIEWKKIVKSHPITTHSSHLEIQVHYQQGVKDTAIWKPTEFGCFSCSLSWEIYRSRNDTEVINSMICHRYIPFNIFFILWRGLRNKLPNTDNFATRIKKYAANQRQFGNLCSGAYKMHQLYSERLAWCESHLQPRKFCCSYLKVPLKLYWS